MMNYRRDVTSVIHISENEKEKIEGYYNVDKTIVCPDEKVTKIVANKLERLQKEDFNRVNIPKFDYITNSNAIRYRVELIKGYHLGTVSKYKDIIYEDVVERDHDWTFDDYGLSNFVIEWKTNKIYAVDFTSYCYFPDRQKRKDSWNRYSEKNKEELKTILNNTDIISI